MVNKLKKTRASTMRTKRHPTKGFRSGRNWRCDWVWSRNVSGAPGRLLVIDRLYHMSADVLPSQQSTCPSCETRCHNDLFSCRHAQSLWWQNLHHGEHQTTSGRRALNVAMSMIVCFSKGQTGAHGDESYIPGTCLTRVAQHWFWSYSSRFRNRRSSWSSCLRAARNAIGMLCRCKR